jgi:hypothetical protein
MIPAFSKGQVDTYKVISLTGKGSFVMYWAAKAWSIGRLQVFYIDEALLEGNSVK